ncbi:1,4-dihydroxy-2-naphthoate polyprenyltransferase [Corynebacterium sp. zg254]|uniref:1,4-dihydroxy-2-naphthoate octaprenyltransferase n=1 Tax=Corynebacterium zhongnanshanii TaxID=2768834 RepID=A0ABQ6VEP8_9CORY|nr:MULTISPECIES: 1,4-dihydroxy-2-naphthoate polyprenyltransferase [Corynebacterium]KAB3522755.1 1,4-dihydroxy-2-naphthoate polyprenyltransferase [Corynebacterium zhongnanshanii]MCR5914186.1 1,4-dihydroxy-2-naphthoate polyprenyltransferase [Corynebacterium sp. zg254]
MPSNNTYPGATARQWLTGARPQTWANAIAPVLAGTAAAIIHGSGDAPRAVLAGIVALALIIGVNYANDYSDGIRGTDEDRSGPLRLTGSRLVQPRKVKHAAFAAFGIAAAAGIALSLLSAWWLILFGALCILAAWFYTGGNNPYGYRGLGEVAVFIFFGLVAVMGTEYTQAGSISWQGATMAVAVGAMSASVNLVNNLRDIPTDADAGKITLAVRLGDTNTRRLWILLNATAMVLTVVLGAVSHWPALLALLASVFLYGASRPVTAGVQGRGLIPVLALTGRGMLTWALIMFAVSFLA